MMGQNRCMLLHLTPHPPGPVSLPMFGIHLISLKETFSKLHKLARVKSEVVQFEVWSELHFFKILHSLNQSLVIFYLLLSSLSLYILHCTSPTQSF